jgi:hypothetical protein
MHTAQPSTEREVFEDFLRTTSATTETVLETIKTLTESHADLLEVVESMTHELATVSIQLAALQADHLEAPATPRTSGFDPDAEHMLRHAAALAQHAATLLAGGRPEDDAASERPLRSVQ